MNKELVLKLWDTQTQMRADPEYRKLLSEWDNKNEQFMRLLNSLEKEAQKTVLDYLGYLLELHYKTAEYLLNGENKR